MSVDELIQAKLKRIDESHRVQAGTTALLVIDMQHGFVDEGASLEIPRACLLYTSPSPRDRGCSRMPSSA